MTISISNKL